MKFVDEIEFQEKRVFVRADLNAPIGEDGKVADDTRLKAALDTIEFIAKSGGKVILASHLGRPKGSRQEKYSLKPVFERLSELSDTKFHFSDDCVGFETNKTAQALKAKEVLLLENLRFHQGEEANDEEFSRELSLLADVYVNDAFATAHRAHASTEGMVQFFRVKAAGFTIKKELEYFDLALSTPEKPFVAIFGGAKVSTKLKAIQNVSKKADTILVGGAMANTFFAAQGHEVGKSLIEQDMVSSASKCLETCANLVIPEDVVIATALAPGEHTEVVPSDQIPADKMALDIGPLTIRRFREEIAKAKTIVWNGPLGAFETDGFSSGTYAIVDALAEHSGLTVVGGGDTDLALHQRGAMQQMSYVSTAGGAFLKLLEGEQLPAIEALK